MEPRSHGNWFIALTLLLAVLLSITPISGTLAFARPSYLIIALTYWIIEIPHRVGVVVACLSGLLMDILMGDVLGQSAFSLAVIAYVVQVSYQRLRMSSMLKQATMVGGLSFFHLLVGQWSQGLNGGTQFHWQVFLPVFTTALLWMFAKPLLARAQRVFPVY